MNNYLILQTITINEIWCTFLTISSHYTFTYDTYHRVNHSDPTHLANFSSILSYHTTDFLDHLGVN